MEALEDVTHDDEVWSPSADNMGVAILRGVFESIVSRGVNVCGHQMLLPKPTQFSTKSALLLENQNHIEESMKYQMFICLHGPVMPAEKNQSLIVAPQRIAPEETVPKDFRPIRWWLP